MAYLARMEQPRPAVWHEYLEMLVPPLPWDRPWKRGEGGECVVLLHGLWRGFRAMVPLARRIAGAGFATVATPFPSTRLPIARLAERVSEQVGRFAAGRPVHFVTHSLGGIVLRAMLAGDVPWRTGRVVMLAPPNGGSEIVDRASGNAVMGMILGPAGRGLGSDGLPAVLPGLPAPVESLVIMGDKPSLPFFQKILGGRNDGIVTVDRGALDGARGFEVVDAGHTFIALHPLVIRYVVAFLSTGEVPGRGDCV